MRVAASGGTAVAVTTLGPQQTGHRFPWFAPDGQRFLFYVLGSSDTGGMYLGALDGTAPTLLTLSDSAGVYLPAWPESDGALRDNGWLLWARGGALVAQRLDEALGALTGEPVTVADGVLVSSGGVLRSGVSASSTGAVVYRTGEGARRQLTWVDRLGAVRGTIGNQDANVLSAPRVSPDGRRVVASRTVQGNTDLWLLDGARTSRFTFGVARDNFPVWSRDGTRVVFRSEGTSAPGAVQKLASGGGVEERLIASDLTLTPSSWSIDDVLVYHQTGSETGADIWVVPVGGARSGGSVFLKTPFREAWASFSPDGRWVAYQSDESGPMEIYVRPFAPPGAGDAARGPGRGQTAAVAGGQWQVSTAGGAYPVWRADGKELYYLNPAGAMVAASITVTAATIEPGAPVVLFPTRIYGGGGDNGQGRQYDVARDGRFLINTVLDSTSAPITLLQNWQPPATP